jgi:hypothetical protein
MKTKYIPQIYYKFSRDHYLPIYNKLVRNGIFKPTTCISMFTIQKSGYKKLIFSERMQCWESVENKDLKRIFFKGENGDMIYLVESKTQQSLQYNRIIECSYLGKNVEHKLYDQNSVKNSPSYDFIEHPVELIFSNMNNFEDKVLSIDDYIKDPIYWAFYNFKNSIYGSKCKK